MPTLSTVDHPISKLGLLGTQLLADLIEGKAEGPVQKFIDTGFVVRQSTARARGELNMALRVGIVGAGAMAEYHAKRLGGLPGLSVTAVCDHLPSRARSFAERLGIPSSFTEPGAMCASGEIDAMSVASFDGGHAAPAIAALERGLPVLCEKPMARRLDEAAAMEAAARRARVPALVNFSKRNGGLLGLASSIAASGRLGAPRRLELRYLQSWLLQSSWGDWRSTAAMEVAPPRVAVDPTAPSATWARISSTRPLVPGGSRRGLGGSRSFLVPHNVSVPRPGTISGARAPSRASKPSSPSEPWASPFEPDGGRKAISTTSPPT